MNLIVEKSPRIPWYSDLLPFFAEIEADVRSYAWLWSDIDVDAPLPVLPAEGGAIWVSGNDLFDFTASRPQFNWSVLSAVRHRDELPAVTTEDAPYADGNRGLWQGSPTPQYAAADFEVICWDSSATLLIGAGSRIEAAFRRAYPDAVDLDEQVIGAARSLR